MRKKEKMCVAICILIPILWGFFLVLKYGVNTLYMDELALIPLVDKLSKGTLTMSDIFAQHNEHRMFFPRLLFLFLGELFHYNTKIYMIMSLFLIVGSYLITVYLLYQNKRNNKLFLIQILGVGFLYFNGVQKENFFLGFQIAWFLIILCAVISLYCIQQYLKYGKNSMIVISILCNFVASFSSMQGLWIWLVFLLMFSLCTIKKNTISKKLWIIFLLGMMGSFILYFYHYIKPQGHPDYFAGGLIAVLNYFLVAVGGIFTHNIIVAMILGWICAILSLGAFVIWFFGSAEMVDNFFAMGILIFGYAVIASVAIGRSGFGVEQALSSRYATYVLLSIIGTAILGINKILEVKYTCKIAQLSDKILIVGTALICMMIIGLVIENFAIRNSYQAAKEDRMEIRKILFNYDNESLEALKKVYPFSNYQNASELISLAKTDKINIFWGNYKENGDGRVKEIKNLEKYTNQKVNYGIPEIIGFDQQAYCMDEKFFYINSAWVVDYKENRCAEKVLININNTIYECTYGIQRQDVVDAFENQNYEYSGFTFTIKKDLIQNIKEATFSLIIIGKDGYYETQQFNISDGMEFAYNMNIDLYRDKTDNATYCIDSIGGMSLEDTVDLNNHYFVDIAGWIFQKEIFDRVYVQCGDKAVKARQIERTDVVEAYSNSKILKSGFNVEVPSNWLVNGENNCILYAISDKTKTFAKIPVTINGIR